MFNSPLRGSCAEMCGTRSFTLAFARGIQDVRNCAVNKMSDCVPLCPFASVYVACFQICVDVSLYFIVNCTNRLIVRGTLTLPRYSVLVKRECVGSVLVVTNTLKAFQENELRPVCWCVGMGPFQIPLSVARHGFSWLH